MVLFRRVVATLENRALGTLRETVQSSLHLHVIDRDGLLEFLLESGLSLRKRPLVSFCDLCEVNWKRCVSVNSAVVELVSVFHLARLE